MNAFEYSSPKKVKDAVALLGPGAVVLAGGTDLLSLIKDSAESPERVVNIKKIKDLKGISRRRKTLQIGALTTFQELTDNAEVRRRYPSLVQAVDGVASRQIRNRGTVGGDLCQRPRCWYFRGGFGLLPERDGAGMVREGDNRYHAILGNDGDALFVNPSSLAPALIALGATLTIAGPSGSREASLGEFYTTPTSNNEREYRLAPNEIVTHVKIPGDDWANATYEVRQKQALDWPLAAAAVAVRLNGTDVSEARVVLGHVAPTPWPSVAAAAALKGQALNEETAGVAATAAVEGARPLSGNGYKIRLARVAVKRALLRAAGKEV